MTIIKPNKIKAIKDFIIVSIIMFTNIILSGSFATEKLLFPTMSIFAIGILYVYITTYLPYLKIDQDKIVYKSEYGIVSKISIQKIRNITKGSGLGGYEHALFVYYDSRSGYLKKLRIKSSYFNRLDIARLIQKVITLKDIKLNKELEDFIK